MTYPNNISIVSGIMRGTADLPNKKWEIRINVLAIDVDLTLILRDSLTGQIIAHADTSIHSPEYPVCMAEQGGYDRAQKLIKCVEDLAALQRAAA